MHRAVLERHAGWPESSKMRIQIEDSGIVHEDSEFVELACETWFSLCCAVRGRLPAHTAKDYQRTDNLNFISPFGVHCTHMPPQRAMSAGSYAHTLTYINRALVRHCRTRDLQLARWRSHALPPATHACTYALSRVHAGPHVCTVVRITSLERAKGDVTSQR